LLRNGKLQGIWTCITCEACLLYRCRKQTGNMNLYHMWRPITIIFYWSVPININGYILVVSVLWYGLTENMTFTFRRSCFMKQINLYIAILRTSVVTIKSRLHSPKKQPQYGCFESSPFRHNFVIFVRQIKWFRWNVRHWTSGVNVHNKNSNRYVPF
jgi:hypothetical protein